MKDSVIIYGSKYGSAKRYAERLSEITGIGCISHKKAKNIGKYGLVIYLGALYAGGFVGLKELAKKLTVGQELIVATVGMADPTDPINTGNIRNALKTIIAEPFYNEKKIFYLRGAIDYKHLSIMHRILLSMMYSKISKMPENELDAVSKVILATYGKKVDFVDFDTLKPIADIVGKIC